MGESAEERIAILDGNAGARLCPSYRLLVWLVLGLGSTLSFIGMSSQAAVFTCRRLALEGKTSMATVTSLPNPNVTGPLTSSASPRSIPGVQSPYSVSGRNFTGLGTELSDSYENNDMDISVMISRNGNLKGVTTLPLSSATHSAASTPSSVAGNGSDYSELWTKEAEGWVLSAISIGYYVIQLPTAVLSVRVGYRRLCLGCTCVCLATSLLSIPAMYWGPLASGFVCFVKGASAGALFPTLTSLAAVWSGKTETSLVISIVESGLQVGHAASFLAAAFLCVGEDGWVNVFYTHAVIAVVFGVLFWMLVKERPSEKVKCSFMSTAEQNFLTASMKTKGISFEKAKIPYRSILTSLPVIAIVIAQLGSEWLDCLMVSSLPQFLGVTHGMAQSVELLTSIGFLLSIPVAVVGAKVADWFLDNCHCSASTVRKVYDVLSKGLPALCYLLLSYIDSSQASALSAVYVLAACFVGLTDSAWPANCLDLAPAYTGILVSLGEGLTSWIWTVCLLVVAYFAPQNTPEQWQTVLYITAGLMLACILFYICFASGEKQKWADPEPESSSTEEEEEEEISDGQHTSS